MSLYIPFSIPCWYKCGKNLVLGHNHLSTLFGDTFKKKIEGENN